MSFSISDPRQMYVVKSNALIQESRFSLSAQQQKIMLYVISKIKPEDKEFTEYEFKIQDFCRVCGIDYLNGKNYLDLKRQIKDIAEKCIWVKVENEQGKELETIVRWIERPYINQQDGTIRIKIDELMRPFLLELNRQYTQYKLVYTLRMKSRYSIRLYELIMSYFINKKFTEYHTFTVDELRKRLDAEKYVNFCNFHADVLKVAVNEINEYTDLDVQYRQVKQGRKTVAIDFAFSLKPLMERMTIAEETEKVLGESYLKVDYLDYED